MQPADVARVTSLLVKEYATAMKQEKANALAVAAQSVPPYAQDQQLGQQQQQQQPQHQVSAGASRRLESGLREPTLDLLLCLWGLPWSTTLLLSLEKAAVGVAVFMLLTAATPQEAAEQFAAAEAQRLAAALQAAEANDKQVAAELMCIKDCNKSARAEQMSSVGCRI